MAQATTKEQTESLKGKNFSIVRETAGAIGEFLTSFPLQTALLVAVQYYVYTNLFGSIRLPTEFYRSGEPLKNMYLNWWQFMPVLYSLGAGVLLFPLARWKRIDSDGTIKLVAVICALTFAWKFSLADYNFFFDKSFALERTLLACFAVLVLAHPFFILPFLIVLKLLASQIEYPFGLYSWTDKLMPFGILAIVYSYSLCAAVFRKKPEVCWFTIMALIGGLYFLPAIGKMELGPTVFTWALESRFDHLFINSWINGWLGQVSENTILEIANLAKPFNALLMGGALLVEILALFLLFNRKLSIFLLLSFVALHTAIFAGSGIFFWKWVVADLAVALALCYMSENLRSKLFRPIWAVALIPMIWFSPKFFDTIKLAWFDSPVNFLYKLEVTAENGKTYELGRNFFEPYDLTFAQNRFYFLSTGAPLAATSGTVYTYNKLNEFTSGEPDIEKYENDASRSLYSEKWKTAFSGFLSKFISNKYNSGCPSGLALSAPNHIYMTGQGDLYNCQSKPVSVKVTEVVKYFDEQSVKTLKEKEVLNLKLFN